MIQDDRLQRLLRVGIHNVPPAPIVVAAEPVKIYPVPLPCVAFPVSMRMAKVLRFFRFPVHFEDKE